MVRKVKLSVKWRIFWSVAGAALLVWLVTMGVLTTLTYQRIVEDAETKIELVGNQIQRELSGLMYGNPERLDIYLEAQTLQEQFIDILTRAAWPAGQSVNSGYSYSWDGNPLFSGAARIVYGDLVSQTGNYLRLYPGEGNRFYYLLLDGVFSMEDIERMMTAHRGSPLMDGWTGGEATGYVDKGLFWADELIFYHENGTEDRYTAVEPQQGGQKLRIVFDEDGDFGGSRSYLVARSQEAQTTLARNTAVLDAEAAQATKINGQVTREDGLRQKEVWYDIQGYDAQGNFIWDGIGYATYFPAQMTLLELWKTYLITFLAALALTALFSAQAARRFGWPIASLYRAAKDNGNTNRYRVESGIRELDDLGESLARLTLAEKEAKWKAQEDLKREQSLTRAVAHELKTPLAILRSHAEALSEDIDPAKRSAYLSIIMDESDRMAALVGELLDLSRMEAGAEKLSCEQVDLRALTERVFARIAELARVSLALEPISVSGDPKLLERAISNYASNALRHCAEGGEIRVTLRREGGNAVVTVENDGDPIPAEALAHIWDTFYKVDSARTRGSGTGLGLAIVRSIAALHGGSCAAENRPGAVAFTLTIPAEKGDV